MKWWFHDRPVGYARVSETGRPHCRFCAHLLCRHFRIGLGKAGKMRESDWWRADTRVCRVPTHGDTFLARREKHGPMSGDTTRNLNVPVTSRLLSMAPALFVAVATAAAALPGRYY